MTQDPIIPDLHKLVRQYMKQETANEFKHLQSDPLDLVPVCRVPPPEGHLSSLDLDQPIIREGHPMGVAAQIIHHLFGVSQWRLTVNHPILIIKTRQESLKRR